MYGCCSFPLLGRWGCLSYNHLFALGLCNNMIHCFRATLLGIPLFVNDLCATVSQRCTVLDFVVMPYTQIFPLLRLLAYEASTSLLSLLCTAHYAMKRLHYYKDKKWLLRWHRYIITSGSYHICMHKMVSLGIIKEEIGVSNTAVGKLTAWRTLFEVLHELKSYYL